jgi:hypothetical protein
MLSLEGTNGGVVQLRNGEMWFGSIGGKMTKVVIT